MTVMNSVFGSTAILNLYQKRRHATDDSGMHCHDYTGTGVIHQALPLAQPHEASDKVTLVGKAGLQTQ